MKSVGPSKGLGAAVFASLGRERGHTTIVISSRRASLFRQQAELFIRGFLSGTRPKVLKSRHLFFEPHCWVSESAGRRHSMRLLQVRVGNWSGAENTRLARRAPRFIWPGNSRLETFRRL